MFSRWACYMIAQGIPAKAAVEQASRVAGFAASVLAPCSLASVPPVSALGDEAAFTEILLAIEDMPRFNVAEATATPLGTFVVSIQSRSNFRRLRCTGSCSLNLGIDYKLFIILGTDMPEEGTHTKACRNCFGGDPLTSLGTSSDESSSSSTES